MFSSLAPRSWSFLVYRLSSFCQVSNRALLMTTTLDLVTASSLLPSPFRARQSGANTTFLSQPAKFLFFQILQTKSKLRISPKYNSCYIKEIETYDRPEPCLFLQRLELFSLVRNSTFHQLVGSSYILA